MVNRRAELSIVRGVGSASSPEEAAAVIAAVQQFIRDTVPGGRDPNPAPPPARNPWQLAALREGVDRAPREPLPWI